MHEIRNPIIPGYYPDPSICRVGEDYYLTCSSFELWPGIPVFHSRDLANWEKIANAADVNVSAWAGVGGVMAPTIRYHNGTYYIINANMDHGADCNYIITARDPAGPWSQPVYLTGIPNLDASLFFDEDGTCYIMGTGLMADTPAGSHERCIWAATFDVEAMKMTGEPTPIWDSALRGAASPEAPHIYKKDGWYYLVIAEGGTEHNHCITVARSRTPLGWYEGNPVNPILTHRHLGWNYPICNVGHGDLVETPDGRWYCVMLASRLIGGYHKNMGRESFICPVIWENGWPVLCPGEGKLADSYPIPETPWCPVPQPTVREDFDGQPGLDWVHWGTPTEPSTRVADSKLYVRCLPRDLNEPVRSAHEPAPADACPQTFLSGLFRRQTDIDFELTAKLNFQPEGKECAGLALVQAINHNLRVEQTVADGRQVVQAVLNETVFNHPPFIPGYEGRTESTLLARAEWAAPEVVLSFRIHGQDCEVLYGTENELHTLCTLDLRRMNPTRVSGLVGTVMGMFATGGGVDTGREAAFEWVDYRAL